MVNNIPENKLVFCLTLFFVFLNACTSTDSSTLSQKNIGFNMQPMGGAPMSHPEGEEVPDFIDISGEDETVTYEILNPNVDDHDQYDGLPIDEYVFTLTSISKDENIITYSYLDNDKNTVTEEFEIKSSSVLKNINNNYYYEWWGPEEWTPEEQ